MVNHPERRKQQHDAEFFENMIQFGFLLSSEDIKQLSYRPLLMNNYFPVLTLLERKHGMRNFVSRHDVKPPGIMIHQKAPPKTQVALQTED